MGILGEIDIEAAITALVSLLAIALASIKAYKRWAINRIPNKQYRQAYKETSEELAATCKEMERIRHELNETKKAEEECKDRVIDLTARMERCERILPYALAAQRAQDWESIKDLLDSASDLWMVTSAANGGTILYVNRRMADVLGIHREEIISQGWKCLVHEDDLQNTTIAEGRAWSRSTRVVNRWRASDDKGWAQIRWIAPRYDLQSGVTMALGRFEGYHKD